MLICFDFDGTMVNTEAVTLPDLLNFFKDDYGISMSLDTWMERYHGKSGPSLLAELNAAYGTRMDWAEFSPRRTQRLVGILGQGLDLAPGLAEVLMDLRAREVPFCICTNSQAGRNKLAVANLRLPDEGIRTYLDGRCHSAVEEGRNSKPAPDVYDYALKLYDVAPTAALAVEDSVTGVRAAVAAGMPVLGYVGLSRHAEEDAAKLMAAGAAEVMAHWDEFLPILAKRSFIG